MNVGGGNHIAGYTIDTGGSYPPGCEDDEYIAYSFNRHSGNYGLQFGGFECENGIFQDLSTIAGRTYDISLYVRNAGVGNTSPADMNFSAFFGSNSIFDGFLVGSANYSHITASFVATSATTRLDFLSENDNSFTYLDDISVTAEEETTSTPEPASVFLVGSGLASLIAVRRRQKR